VKERERDIERKKEIEIEKNNRERERKLNLMISFKNYSIMFFEQCINPRISQSIKQSKKHLLNQPLN